MVLDRGSCSQAESSQCLSSLLSGGGQEVTGKLGGLTGLTFVAAQAHADKPRVPPSLCAQSTLPGQHRVS